MPAIWYVDAAGTRAGPVELDQAGGLARNGAISGSTLVWMEGMADWAPADQVAALRGLFAHAAPPPPPPPNAGRPQSTYAPAAAGGGSGLISELGAWGLFWRALVAVIGQALIIPSPWTSTMLWRYVGETTQLPDGRRFGFDGRPGDIWWVFVVQGILLWAGQVRYAQIVTLPLSLALAYFVVKWFCEKLTPPDGLGRLTFKGGFWANLGWMLFYFLSFFTIIGWAWVLAAYNRWLCRNVDGGLAFEFRGSGLAFLWRILATVVASCFVIPIPWVVAWLARWTISQIHVAGRGA